MLAETGPGPVVGTPGTEPGPGADGSRGGDALKGLVCARATAVLLCCSRSNDLSRALQSTHSAFHAAIVPRSPRGHHREIT